MASLTGLHSSSVMDDSQCKALPIERTPSAGLTALEAFGKQHPVPMPVKELRAQS